MSFKRKRVSESPTVEAKTPASSKRRRGANNNQDRTVEQLRQCQELLDFLKTIKLEGRSVLDKFIRNPSKRSDPEYYKEIDNPIDVTRIQQKLRNEDYSQMSQFFDDVSLLIDNALAYYKKEDTEHADAVELERVFGEKRRLMETGEEWRTNGDLSRVKKELMDEETRSASPSARSAATRSSTGGDASIDEVTADDILTTIIEHTDEHKRLISPPFRLLQSPEEFPLYYEKIDQPIDLKTIAEKTRAGCYTSMAGLETDIKLLVGNAKVFNEHGSTIHTDADTILKVFTKKKNEAGHKAVSNKRREHCRDVVDALIAQSATDADVDDALSEDSEEDEDLASSSEWGWQLYWAVRNEQAEGSDENLVSDPFVELPSKRYYPDYYDEIKSPMSLFMINKKLKMGRYGSLDELVKDFALVFGNAMEYNVEASDIFKAAKVLKELTLKKAKQLQPSFDAARWAAFRPPTSDNADADVKMVASTPAKTPKHAQHQPKMIKVKEEPIDEDMMSESSETPPPSMKKKMRRMKPISTGFTVLPDCKPGRKSIDELMLRFRLKLLHFWNLVYDFKAPHPDGGGSGGNKRKSGAHQDEAYWPAGAFVDLPDRKQWRDYYAVIKQPMSMSMIKDKIENNLYESSTNLIADFHTMFKNAKTFNEPGSDLHRDASRLEKMVADAHDAIPDAPYDSPLILKEKMGWIKTKMPMYSSKSKAPIALGASDSPPTVTGGAGAGRFGPQYGYDDDDSNSGSSIRSPAPSSSKSSQATPAAATPGTPTTYRPKIPIKERMEKLNEEGRRMYDLLFALKKHEDAAGRNVTAAFHKLPSKLELPSYYELIKKPLDFARIQQKLTCQYYRTPADLVADFKLMFDNACKFNEPESQIYKDAITMQRVLLEKKKEFFSRAGDGASTSAQMEIKSMLMTLFVAVFNKKDEEEGRCHSDAFVDLTELMRAKSIPEKDWPFSFEQIKRNIDKGRYRRLDRFQSDFFHLFATARRVARSDSTLFDDAAALQMELIRARDETCKALLHSGAYAVLWKDVAEAIEAERKAKVAEEADQERKEEERGRENAEPSQANGTAAATKDEQLHAVMVGDVQYCDGDYALVSPSEKEVKEPHLMRIEKMWRDGEGATLVTGRWYFRPQETYHLATKKFADNEVFLTNFRDTVTSDRLMTKAAIVQPKQWCKYAVKGFEPENVFVCEERYLGKTLHFKKIKAWPFPADDDAFELEERATPLAITRAPREMRKGVNGVKEDDESSQSSQSSQESAEEDERCTNVLILDVDRPEVRLPGVHGPDADGRTYFQQMTDKSGRSFYLGNSVLVFNHLKPFCDVMRIDKLWRESDGAEFFSGGWFARPTDLYHDLSHLFFRNEVFAVVQADQTHRIEEIQHKCAVLPLKQFVKERPTEVPECDVFVCEARVVGLLDESTAAAATAPSTSNGTGIPAPPAPAAATVSDCSLFVNPVTQEQRVPPMHLASAQKFLKLKHYTLSLEVIEEEIFLFRAPLPAMDKEPSPMLTKAAIEELEMDESVAMATEAEAPNDATDSAEAKELVQWLSHQPKLNAKSKSGYILFSAEIRKRIMAENPDAGFGEVSKIVGVEWKKLTEEQKKQYEVRAEYIASERAKQDAANIAAGKTVQLTPGHVRVYVCKWTSCDYQFDCAEGLAEHVILYHTSQIIVDSENQYVCMWLTCLRNRKEGKPFPSLPRLHRHIREKHVGNSFKSMAPNGRSRNYYKFVAAAPAENGGVTPGGGQLVQFPFGMHPSQAPPGAFTQNNHGGHPGMHPGAMGPPHQQQGGQPMMMNGHHHHAAHADHPHPHAPPAGTPVRIVNGVDPRYHQSPAGPMHHQGVPHGHNYAAPMPQTPQQPHHPQQHHPGQPHPGHGPMTAQHHPQQQQHHPGMPGPPPGHHGQPQQMSAPGPMADARTVISLNRSAVEPVFVPPPSSVHTRRVLHSETYLRYIESLSNARQRSVSQYDRSLRAHPRNTQSNMARLPANWLRESRGNQPIKEDEVVRALWRLREELLESTVDIERDYAGVL